MSANAKLETSCKNEHEPPKIAIYTVVFIIPSLLNKNGGDRLRKKCLKYVNKRHTIVLCDVFIYYFLSPISGHRVYKKNLTDLKLLSISQIALNFLV
jgi:hypothetical protein